MRHWRIYRNLGIVYGVALIVWLNEYRRGMQEDDVFVAPDSSYPQVVSELYPERCEPEFYQGFRALKPAELNLDSEALNDPEAIERSIANWKRELRVAAEHYQRSIDSGLISQEKVFYAYALTLMRLQDDPAKIDQAIADWRRNFPYSRERPLEQWREIIAAGHDRLAQQIELARQAKEEAKQHEALERAYQGSAPRASGTVNKP